MKLYADFWTFKVRKKEAENAHTVAYETANRMKTCIIE